MKKDEYKVEINSERCLGFLLVCVCATKRKTLACAI